MAASGGLPQSLAAACQAAAYISDLLAGLDYLHSHGVVHGNIKPDNVLLTPEGRCKLSDFGLMQGGARADENPNLPSPMQLALLVYACALVCLWMLLPDAARPGEGVVLVGTRTNI